MSTLSFVSRTEITSIESSRHVIYNNFPLSRITHMINTAFVLNSKKGYEILTNCIKVSSVESTPSRQYKDQFK